MFQCSTLESIVGNIEIYWIYLAQVLSVQLNKTSAHHIVCPLPQAKSHLVSIPLLCPPPPRPQTPFPLAVTTLLSVSVCSMSVYACVLCLCVICTHNTLLNRFTFFHPVAPNPSAPAAVSLFFVSIPLLLFRLLESTCKWDHTVLVKFKNIYINSIWQVK